MIIDSSQHWQYTYFKNIISLNMLNMMLNIVSKLILCTLISKFPNKMYFENFDEFAYIFDYDHCVNILATKSDYSLYNS